MSINVTHFPSQRRARIGQSVAYVHCFYHELQHLAADFNEGLTWFVEAGSWYSIEKEQDVQMIQPYADSKVAFEWILNAVPDVGQFEVWRKSFPVLVRHCTKGADDRRVSSCYRPAKSRWVEYQLT